ncbi:MAG: hypothetical protein D6785_10875 [Planctomycetota bacterium]|nr:MAG: hypothetical protein D6785_10875 [Planctomycetota bacterium]
MSTRQLLRQIEYTAKNLSWSGGGKVFHDVIVSVLGWEFFVDSDLRTPYLIIQADSSTSNEENPQLKQTNVRLSIVSRHEGDRFGRQAAIGGHGSWSQTNSFQKGIFEIQEKLWETLEKEGRDSGVIYMLSGRSERVIAGQGTEQEESLAIMDIEFQATIFERSIYPDAHNFKASKSGNDAVLTWQDPPVRYDLIQTGGLIIARKLGSNPTTADQIATVNIGVQNYTDVNPGAGTWHYGLFVQYDEVNDPPVTATNTSQGIFSIIAI